MALKKQRAEATMTLTRMPENNKKYTGQRKMAKMLFSLDGKDPSLQKYQVGVDKGSFGADCF